MQIVREADVRWTSGQFGTGLQTAILSGNPSQPGPYVIRVKFAPGTMSPPHFHPEARYVLVLKGTWWVGAGPKWDREATTPVPAGSLVIHHPNKIHFDGAKDEEVVLQIVGIGPERDDAGRRDRPAEAIGTGRRPRGFARPRAAAHVA
jgi:quercetin dioxygenase-like cupin family protein